MQWESLCSLQASLVCPWYVTLRHTCTPSAVQVMVQDLLTGPELALLASWKHGPNCAGQVSRVLNLVKVSV